MPIAVYLLLPATAIFLFTAPPDLWAVATVLALVFGWGMFVGYHLRGWVDTPATRPAKRNIVIYVGVFTVVLASFATYTLVK